MGIHVTSTKAKVRNLKAVRAVLRRYEWRNVEISVKNEDGGWMLEVSYDDSDWDLWGMPEALPKETVPVVEEDEDEAAWEAAEDYWLDHGGEGFLALLLDLAP